KNRNNQIQFFLTGAFTMKSTIQNTKLFAGKMNSQQVRLIWALVTLLLFVLGAGAPEGGSGWLGG
ncbi:MAG TPA: hypothetical protein VI451_16270, partial [Anaerolineales bacterium]|nr:hypothetical protein [Anaerolineales bacterium]